MNTETNIDHWRPGQGCRTTATEHAAETGMDAEPAELAPAGHSPSTFDIVDLILKQPRRLEALTRVPEWQAQMLPRNLAISLGSFGLYGLIMVLAMLANQAQPRLIPLADSFRTGAPLAIQFDRIALEDSDEPAAPLWRSPAVWGVVAAYGLGLIAAIGICLPSLYFYGLLAGLKMTPLDVVAHALKGQAIMAVALVGILPIYLVGSLGMFVLNAPFPLVRFALYCGLALPFLAGLFGTQSLYRGFMGLSDTLPIGVHFQRRCLLNRLVLAWSSCFTVISPIMIFTIWEWIARLSGHPG